MARWKRKSVSTYSFFHLHKARCSVALSERTSSIRPSQGRGGPLHAIFVASGITHQVRPNSLHRKVTVTTSHTQLATNGSFSPSTQSVHHNTTCRISSQATNAPKRPLPSAPDSRMSPPTRTSPLSRRGTGYCESASPCRENGPESALKGYICVCCGVFFSLT